MRARQQCHAALVTPADGTTRFCMRFRLPLAKTSLYVRSASSPAERDDDKVENANSNDCRVNPYQTGWSKMGDVEREASVMSSRDARKAAGNAALALTLAFARRSST